jgi:hypothetical protein
MKNITGEFRREMDQASGAAGVLQPGILPLIQCANYSYQSQ